MSFAIAIGIFALGAVIESTLHGFNLHGVWEWADNGVCAFATALVVFLYERRHLRKVNERLRVISEMNHHVRNALQPILYAADGAIPHEEQIKLIRGAVSRIQWALTDVLPGESESPRPLPIDVK